MCNIQSIKLNDGRDFPMVGLGTFRVTKLNLINGLHET